MTSANEHPHLMLCVNIPSILKACSQSKCSFVGEYCTTQKRMRFNDEWARAASVLQCRACPHLHVHMHEAYQSLECYDSVSNLLLACHSTNHFIDPSRSHHFI